MSGVRAVMSDRSHLRLFLRGVGAVALGYALTHAMGRYYTVDINLTESLPYHLLYIDKTALPGRGDLLAFRVGQNRQYPAGTLFGKVVGGVAGDHVMRIDRQFFINGEPLAYAKPRSKLGRPLAAGPTGIIPAGHYFVYTNHKDSYDSRYADIGWVAPSQVVGRAVALF